jgi:hypothetical protein
MVHVLLVALMVIHPREVAEEGKEDGGKGKAGWGMFVSELECLLLMVQLQEQEKEAGGERQEDQGGGIGEGGEGRSGGGGKGRRENSPAWITRVLAKVLHSPEASAGALRAREEFTGHAALDAGVQYLASAVVMGAEGRKEWEEVRATFWADGTAALLNILREKIKDRGGLMLWGPGGWEGLEGMGGGGEGSVCGMCRTSAEMLGRNTLLRCARCRRVRYCSKACQVAICERGREGGRAGGRKGGREGGDACPVA